MMHIPAVVLALVLVAVTRGEDCVQQGGIDFRSDPDDCRVYYQCVLKTLHRFSCAENLAFNVNLRTCVHAGSELDICGANSVPDVNPICLGTPETLIPHPNRCSLYYNCSAPSRYNRWEKNLQECIYPRVYNSQTARCEHYSMVDCGTRDIPLGLCDYKYTECQSSHCIPCNVHSPSCRGLTDGLHAHTYKLGSPYYMVCVGHRLVYTGSCPSFQDKPQFFHPDRKTCVFAHEIDQ